jgi:hypothetical protein
MVALRTGRPRLLSYSNRQCDGMVARVEAREQTGAVMRGRSDGPLMFHPLFKPDNQELPSFPRLP